MITKLALLFACSLSLDQFEPKPGNNFVQKCIQYYLTKAKSVGYPVSLLYSFASLLNFIRDKDNLSEMQNIPPSKGHDQQGAPAPPSLSFHFEGCCCTA